MTVAPLPLLNNITVSVVEYLKKFSSCCRHPPTLKRIDHTGDGMSKRYYLQR